MNLEAAQNKQNIIVGCVYRPLLAQDCSNDTLQSVYNPWWSLSTTYILTVTVNWKEEREHRSIRCKLDVPLIFTFCILFVHFFE